MQTIQDVEKKLYNYAILQRRLRELQEQADEILGQRNALVDGLLRAPRLDDVRVQGGCTSDPVFAAVQKMIDVYGVRLDAIRNEIVDVFYHIDETERIMNNARLTEQERQYVQLRYFDGMRASHTAAKMNFSESQTLRIKRSALKKMTGK